MYQQFLGTSDALQTSNQDGQDNVLFSVSLSVIRLFSLFLKTLN